MTTLISTRAARRRTVAYVVVVAATLVLMAFSSNPLVRDVQSGIGFAFRPIQGALDGVAGGIASIGTAIAEIDRLRVDNGSLKGFRVPGSRFRRIPRAELYSFMRDNGIPTDALESGKRKVLIVDDDQELVELLVDSFARDGRFDIKTANNGFDAGMLVKEFRPDLVVLDIMLPDINGKEVCQRVRSDNTLEQVKIICISGMVEQDKIADLRASGANDFLQKPFSVDKLLERSYDLLEIERPVAT